MDASSETDPDASAATTDGTDTVDTTNVDPSSATDETDTTDTPSDSSDATTDSSDATTDLTDPDPTGTGSDSTDVVTTETDGVTTDVLPDGGPGDGAIDPPEGMVVVSSFDMDDPTGFRDGSSTFATITVDRADSIGTVVLPFTAGGQQGAWSFNFTGDYCGYELVARIRLVSGFNLTEAAPGRVQLRAWNSGWTNFAGSYDPLTGVGEESQLGEWVEYSFDLDEQATAANAAFDSSDLNSVGISFITPVTGTFTEARIELDWIGLMPKPGGCPDATTTDDLTDVTTDDTNSVDTTSVDTTADGGAPNVIVVSELDAVDGFAGYTNITDHTPVLTAADSIGTLEVPFTGGNYQQSSWNFNGFTAPADGLCGYNVKARVRLDSGFNAAGAATGGVQLRAWSDNWATTLQNWTNLDAATQTGEWIEYTLDLDATEPPEFDPTAVNAVGIAFISGGEVSAEYTPATFSIDWIRLEEKVAGEGGCFSDETDGGVDSGTDTGTPGDLDGGAADVDASLDSGGMIDEDAGVIDEDAGVIDEDGGVTGNEDAGTDGAVEDNGSIDPPLNALAVLTSFDVDGDDTSGTLLAPGYYAEQGPLAASTTWVVADSVAQFTVPHTAAGEAYTLFVAANNIDGTGHELIVRLRVVSDLTGLAAPHIQLSTSTSNGAELNYQYNDFAVAVDTSSDYWNWKEYKLDIDAIADFPAIIQGVGVGLNSWYSGSTFGTVEYEIDWVAIVPKP